MTPTELAERYLILNKDGDSGLRKALPDEVRKEVKRIELDRVFVPANLVPGSTSEHQSPSGRYHLVVTRYSGNGWSCSLGLVHESGSGVPIAEVRRDHAVFPFAWVEEHHNGHTYLICGEDSEGQTVIELDTTKRVDFVPSSAKDGNGFIWTSINPSPDGLILAVEGCYFACPYEVRMYDFKNPLSHPLPPIGYGYDLETFVRWQDANTAVLTGTDNFYFPESAFMFQLQERVRRGEMTQVHLDSLIADTSNWDYRDVHEQLWTRPPPREILDRYVHYAFTMRRARDLSFHGDVLASALQLLNMLSEEDQLAFKDTELGATLKWAIDKAYFAPVDKDDEVDPLIWPALVEKLKSMKTIEEDFTGVDPDPFV